MTARASRPYRGSMPSRKPVLIVHLAQPHGPLACGAKPRHYQSSPRVEQVTCRECKATQAPALRPATKTETADWLAGYSRPEGAQETPEGLLLPVTR